MKVADDFLRLPPCKRLWVVTFAFSYGVPKVARGFCLCRFSRQCWVTRPLNTHNVSSGTPPRHVYHVKQLRAMSSSLLSWSSASLPQHPEWLNCPSLLSLRQRPSPHRGSPPGRQCWTRLSHSHCTTLLPLRSTAMHHRAQLDYSLYLQHSLLKKESLRDRLSWNSCLGFLMTLLKICGFVWGQGWQAGNILLYGRLCYLVVLLFCYLLYGGWW